MNPKSAKGVYANLMRRQLMGLGASTEHLDETWLHFYLYEGIFINPR